MEYNLDVVVSFDSEERRDDFMMSAITSEEFDVDGEALRYSGARSVLMTSWQAETLSKLTAQFNGKPRAEPEPAPIPPSSYQEMVSSWDALMKELKSNPSPS